MVERYWNGYSSGFIERKQNGIYAGNLSIDGVDISPVEGVYFKKNGKQYLWIKRVPALEYDEHTQQYLQRQREPRWETYLEKSSHQVIAYRGECTFLRFKYKIVGIWDVVLGKEKQRLNIYIERLPMSEQTIINAINERNKKTRQK